MAKYAVTETHDASGKPVGWALLVLPDDFREGDLYPAPQASDRYFKTSDEAFVELAKRIDQPKPK